VVAACVVAAAPGDQAFQQTPDSWLVLPLGTPLTGLSV
jgi:hypothetical protein